MTLDDVFYYITDNNKLFRVINGNSKLLVLDFIDLPSMNFSGADILVKFKDELLIPTDLGLKRIFDDGTIDFLLEGNVFEDYSSYLLASKSGHNILFGNNDLLYHYDGDQVHEFSTGDSLYKSITTLGSDHFLINSRGPDLNRKYTYNSNSKLLTEFNLDNSTISLYYLSGSQPKLLTFSYYWVGGSSLKDYKLYNTDPDLEDLTLVATYNKIGSDYSDNIATVDDKGLLILGNNLLKLSAELNPIVVEEIRINNYDGFQLKDDNIYFWGMDKDLGRQLYSYDASLSAIDPINEIQPSISIYPNPVNDKLHLNMDEDSIDLLNFKYQIYSSAGHLCAFGSASGSIETSMLGSGSYFLYLYDGEKNYFLKFVKD